MTHNNTRGHVSTSVPCNIATSGKCFIFPDIGQTRNLPFSISFNKDQIGKVGNKYSFHYRMFDRLGKQGNIEETSKLSHEKCVVFSEFETPKSIKKHPVFKAKLNVKFTVYYSTILVCFAQESLTR
jgi:hypothetical protein